MIRENLSARIASTRCVLFDFDGPICRVFAHHAGQTPLSVAADMRQLVRDRGISLELTDPLDVLRAVGELRPGSELLAELEEWLTRQELRAVPGAWPTMYADRLIQTWRATGCRLAVTADTSARTVAEYLARRGLTDCFGSHVYGRSADVGLLKPHPQQLLQALRDLDTDPGTALMIGDSVSDLRAAEAAGVPFLGYATHDRRVDELAAAGADLVLNTFEPVLDVLWNR
ncbi:HAD family hydrolase [Streptomyces sp. NPDC051320]|uniref:HAD family hydrolase n=1 Tax=Streptomyces sp. NPDC051320 TaxID=3154644 RepID=UPI003427F4F6